MSVRIRMTSRRLDDGRDELVIECDDEAHSRLTFYGELTMAAQWPVKNQALCWDLHMRLRGAPHSEYRWGTFVVEAPREDGPELLPP